MTTDPVADLLDDADAKAELLQPADLAAIARLVTHIPPEEFMQRALKNQPAVRAALARVAARQADVGIPRGQWLPSVGVTAQLLVGTANNTTASYLGAPLVVLGVLVTWVGLWFELLRRSDA